MLCQLVTAEVIVAAYSFVYIHHCVCEMYCYFNLVVKPRAASPSSDVAVSTSEAPAANVAAPSTNTAPKLSPLSAGAAPPHVVSDLNEDTPSLPV